MRTALAIGMVACSAAAGDEVISTFGNDWAFAQGWALVGQSLTVPQSNVLESLSFVMRTESDEPTHYFVYLAEWYSDIGDWNHGPAAWTGQGYLEGDGLPHTVSFDDIGLLLARESEWVILVYAPDVVDHPDVAFVDDAYAGGALITRLGLAEPIIVWDDFDMLFSAGFSSCKVDLLGDGELNIFDFIAFQGLFTQGSMKADCTGDGVLNVLDFVCFQAAFQAGCGSE